MLLLMQKLGWDFVPEIAEILKLKLNYDCAYLCNYVVIVFVWLQTCLGESIISSQVYHATKGHLLFSILIK